MPDPAKPSPWQHRLYTVHDGFAAETWNPMAGEWQRHGSDPWWPASDEAAASEWVEVENREQAARNAAYGLGEAT